MPPFSNPSVHSKGKRKNNFPDSGRPSGPFAARRAGLLSWDGLAFQSAICLHPLGRTTPFVFKGAGIPEGFERRSNPGPSKSPAAVEIVSGRDVSGFHWELITYSRPIGLSESPDKFSLQPCQSVCQGVWNSRAHRRSWVCIGNERANFPLGSSTVGLLSDGLIALILGGACEMVLSGFN
ncbi:hypothetical protein CDAR_390761 [Caerostris darwini]|uniref:Uncharacterized protein n=1 Tax=Caerostris darwini TaxID=1538125 RepID=A0AAV4TCN4_9ARAC|nr:hypothetical protein CDAR_390761 [Caerostris darwini]